MMAGSALWDNTDNIWRCRTCHYAYRPEDINLAMPEMSPCPRCTAEAKEREPYQPAVCVICHYDTLPDDMVVPPRSGRCLCLRCFRRETEDEHPMPKWLRQDVSAAADSAGP